ncbi:hypothetical protein D9M68_914600 [compost metagenome]
MEIVFSWSTAGKYKYNDYAMILIYDVENRLARYHPAIAKRKEGTATFKVDEAFSGRSVEVYLAFSADDQKQRSNSLYLGKLTIT